MNKQEEILNAGKIATRVSMISIIWNLILSLLKLAAGIIAHSGAMISDAVHSTSDVFSSFVVIIGIRISVKESDKEHPYGHERMECIAAIILAMVLFLTGAGIGFSAIKTLLAGHYSKLTPPGALALVAAVISIGIKESMYWYTRHYAKVINSGALMADAWHHRSDALSSVGAVIGIAGARLGYPVLDSVASLIICLFIAKASIDIFMDATDKIVDHACDEHTEQSIREKALSIPGVEGVDFLKTRIFGNKIYVDIEICADGHLSLFEAHDIAEAVHDIIEKDIPLVKHVMVHTNPKQ